MEQELAEVRGAIEAASMAYYHGEPIMEDADFDALVARARAIGVEEPLGHAPSGDKIRLLRPMASLAKVHSLESLDAWLAGLPDDAEVSIGPKWDGIAVQLERRGGRLVMAATRGDGQVGESIMSAMSVADISQAARDGISVGELLMSEADLARINSTYGTTYANTRNAVAGLARRTDPEGLAMAACIRFVDHEGSLHTESMAAGDLPAVHAAVARVAALRADPAFGYGIDGAVAKATDPDIRQFLGESRHSPRWAVALKYESPAGSTRVQGVSWRTGRTGRVVPVVSLEPVEVHGVSISSATLHNAAMAAAMALAPGDVVLIRRAGDVIPYVDGVVERSGAASFAPPIVCPNCGRALVERSQDLVCTASCDAGSAILHALRCLEADGIGPGTVEALLGAGLVAGPGVPDAIGSLLDLEPDAIEPLDGFGEASAAIVVDAIRGIRDMPLESWVQALGIPGMGWAVSESLCEAFPSLPLIALADEDALLAIPGFGPHRAEAVLAASGAVLALESVLAARGVHPSPYAREEVVEGSAWNGLSVVLTGTLPDGVSRSEAAEWLEARGASVSGSVTRSTDVLVHGERAGSKLAKAESLGTRLVPGAELVAEMAAASLPLPDLGA